MQGQLNPFNPKKEVFVKNIEDFDGCKPLQGTASALLPLIWAISKMILFR